MSHSLSVAVQIVEIACCYTTTIIILLLVVPVTLVDYYRADYGSPTTSLYQFYFVFLREVLVGINGLEVGLSSTGSNALSIVAIFIGWEYLRRHWVGFL